MTHRHEFATADAFPLSYRCRRRCSQSSATSANGAGAPDSVDKSRVVGDVLKRFAHRNHYGPNFAQFLDSAYQQRASNNKECETAPQTSDDTDHRTGNEIQQSQSSDSVQPSFKRELVVDSDSSRSKSSQRPQHYLIGNGVSDDGSPPSLADDNSTWMANDGTEDIRDEEKRLRNTMQRGSLRQSEREIPDEVAPDVPHSSGVAARAASSTHHSADNLTRGSPETSSMASIDYDHAIATLVSIFSSPWTAEILGAVLGYCKGSITDTIDTILSHGDGDPENLIEQLNKKTCLINGEPGQLPCKTEHLGLEEEQEHGVDAENAVQTRPEGERLALQGAAPPTSSLASDIIDGKSDIPSEILPIQERDMDEVSLLSCSVADGSCAGSDKRDPLGRGPPQLHRSAPAFRTLHEEAIPRDDSFARLLVSNEWTPKFQKENVHEC